MISSVDLAYNGVSRAKDWVSVDCATNMFYIHMSQITLIYAHYLEKLEYLISRSGNKIVGLLCVSDIWHILTVTNQQLCN